MNDFSRTLLFLIGALATLLSLAPGFAPADDTDPIELVYVKGDSREETRAASLEASGVYPWPEVWNVVGPFEMAAETGLATVHPPEGAVDLSARYDGLEKEIRWRPARFSHGRVNSLKRFKPSDGAICYLYQRIEADEPRQVRIALGSDDGLAVWFNGEPLLFRDVERGAAADQDFVTLEVREGTNELLLKVANRSNDWAFYFQPQIPPLLLVQLDRRLEDDFPRGEEGRHYRIYPLPLPDGESIEVGGLAFRDDGNLWVGTRRGDVWLVENPLADDVHDIHMQPIARGLHEVLGLKNIDGDLYLVQRPEVTRLRDTDDDDRIDEFLTVCDGFGVSGNYHEYIYGPAVDAEGNLFVTLNLDLGSGAISTVPYRGCVIRVAPDGAAQPWAYGLRSPNGVNFSPDGRLFYTDNQGDWIATCKLQEVRYGEFYGHRSAINWWPKDSPSDSDATDTSTEAPSDSTAEPEFVPPTIWFPYAMCRSASDIVWDTTEGRFGPFAGQCFVGEYTNSLIMRVALEEVQGRMQGACFPFIKGFQSGVNRLRFAPDGSLMVGGTNRGWGTLGGRDQALERVVYSGQVPFEIHSMQVTPTGWRLTFTKPINAELAADPARYFIKSYTYHYWETYGSPEIERRENPIRAVEVGDDGQSVHLTVPERQTGRVFHLSVSGLNATDGSPLLHGDAYYTLNALP